MKRYELNEDEINRETVKKILNDMFYEIRDLRSSVNKTGDDIICDCLDGSVNGVPGVMLLMGRLKGGTYSLVTNPETGEREYVKDKPADPKKIYNEANKLVDIVNDTLKKYKVTNKR